MSEHPLPVKRSASRHRGNLLTAGPAAPILSPPRARGSERAAARARKPSKGDGDMAMTQDEVFARIREIIADNLSVDAESIMLEQSFKDDLEADSLDLAEMIMDFEDKFGVGDISEDDAEQIKTVGDAVTFITNALANQ
jgi:acyl carrier protein